MGVWRGLRFDHVLDVGDVGDGRGNRLGVHDVQPIVMRAGVALVGVAVLLAACGSLEQTAPANTGASLAPVPTDPPTPSASLAPVPTDPPTPSASPAASPTCASSGAAGDVDLTDAQFAFVGTVTDVAAEVHPWTTDPENPEHTDDPEPVAWVAFDVERWYTQDWGTTFTVWVPNHHLAAGERAAVAGNAYWTTVGQFSGQSGEVERCVHLEASESPPAAWEEQFAGGVVPGAGVPEGAADPATVAALETARAEWQANEPASYSFVLSTWDSHTSTSCDRSWAFRVVVVDGEPVQAVGTADGCEVDPASLPSVDDVFASAIRFAGATEFSYEVDPTGAVPISFGAYDRSVEASMRVQDVSPETSLTVSGWDQVGEAAFAGRERWKRAGSDYGISIRTGGGERMQFDVDARVVDGEVEDLTVNGEPADPASFTQPWQPLTVDDVFALIDEMSGDGNVVAVFDATTGAPVMVWFDPMLNAIDDELEVRVVVTPA